MTSPSSESAISAITETEIANYLIHTPEFFDRHADVLASVQLSSPHSHRIVSLQERQAEMMRSRIRELELQTSGMIRYGQTNVEVTDKLHAWTCRLLALEAREQAHHAIAQGLKDIFNIPQVALRVWSEKQIGSYPQTDALITQEEKQVAELITTCQSGVALDHPFVQWLEQPQNVNSLAIIPIVQESTTSGILILASDDEKRFSTDMGTLFLQRLSELSAALLKRLL